MSNGNEAFDLCIKLRQRLREMNLVKEKSQIKINVVTEQLQKLLAKVPKKARETAAQLDSKINELESIRTRTSIPLSMEKDILRQIDAVKKKKVQNEEHLVLERSIQEKKSELSALKDDLRNVTAQIAELETVLAKMELADRLGCAPSDLKTRVVDCPDDKLGRIIGKNGANIKKLEDKSGCIIDVDKVMKQIHIQGSDAAIVSVVNELENVIRATTEGITLDLATHSYLFAKRMESFNRLQGKHPLVFFDLQKDSLTMQVRGLPDDIAAAKQYIASWKVTLLSITFNAREASLIIGKGGSHINQLSEDFDISIDIEKTADGVSTANLVGNGEKPHQALAKIREILFQQEDVEKSILTRTIVRYKLLSDSGTLIKQLQKDVTDACSQNVIVFFDKNEKVEGKSSMSTIVIKCPRCSIEKAFGYLDNVLRKYESMVASVPVDPEILSFLLGKGISAINGLREKYNSVELYLSKDTGEILIMTEDSAIKASVISEIELIIARNQTSQYHIEAQMFGLIFGPPGKELREYFQGIGVDFQKDTSECLLILRGSNETIKQAVAQLDDFVSNHFSRDVEFSADDEQYLYSRNVFSKLQSDHDVRIIAPKGKNRATIRGKEGNVFACSNELRKLLVGDDTFAVTTLSVPEVVLGLIIGKGGAGIAQLEHDFCGVSVFVSRISNCMCFRGPKDKVEDCREVVVRKIATTVVSQQIELNRELYQSISSASEFLRVIKEDIPVQIIINETSLKLKGISSDVADAKCLVEEFLTGIYKASVIIDSGLFEKVATLVNENSCVNEIKSETNVSVDFEPKNRCVRLSGKRSNVKRAKSMFIDVLDRAFPGYFYRLKVPKRLVKAVNDSTALATIFAKSRAAISFERDLSSFLVQASSVEDVIHTVGLLKARQADCEKLYFVFQFEQSESWLMPIVIAKGGEEIKKIEAATKCVVELHPEDLEIGISGANADAVQFARSMFDAFLDQIRKENVILDVPETAMATFVGKNNVNIKRFEGLHDVSFVRMKRHPGRFLIQGGELAVESAILALNDWLDGWMTQNVGESISIDSKVTPLLLSDKASLLSDVQKIFTGVRIEVDKKDHSLNIRGGTKADQKQALNKIKSIILELQNKNNVHPEQSMKQSQVPVDPSGAGFEHKTIRPEINIDTGAFLSKIQGDTNGVVKSNKTDVHTLSKSVDVATDSTSHLVNLLIPNNFQTKQLVTKPVEPTSNSASQDLFNLLTTKSPVSLSQVVKKGVENSSQDVVCNGSSYYMSVGGLAIRL